MGFSPRIRDLFGVADDLGVGEGLWEGKVSREWM